MLLLWSNWILEVYYFFMLWSQSESILWIKMLNLPHMWIFPVKTHLMICNMWNFQFYQISEFHLLRMFFFVVFFISFEYFWTIKSNLS
jgi:hypothetical protein